MDALEVIYFQRQGIDLKGYHTDDLYETLSENRIDSGSMQSRFARFEVDMDRLYRECSNLELRLLLGEQAA